MLVLKSPRWSAVCTTQLFCGAAALPLQEDFQEAGPVYGALCGLVTNAETAPKVANLVPQIVQVCRTCYSYALICWSREASRLVSTL